MRTWLLAFLLVVAAAGGRAFALDLGVGNLPLEYETGAIIALNGEDQIFVAGTVSGGSIGLVLRLDDESSTGYSSRVNSERILPAGEFSFSVPVKDLRKPDGHSLDLSGVRRIVLGRFSGDGVAVIKRFEVSAAAAAVKPPPVGKSAASADRAGGIGLLDLGRGSLPIEYEPRQATKLSPTDQILIEGTVEGGEAGLVVRMDDGHSTDYASRVNYERTVPQGGFAFALSVGDLKTPSGRALDLSDIRRVVLGRFAGGAAVSVCRFEVLRGSSSTAAAAPAPVPPPESGTRKGMVEVLDLGSGTLPVEYEGRPAIHFDDSDEISISGTVDGGDAAVVLRVDDGRSMDYASRVNDERTLAPGNFELSVPVKSLATSNGRHLDLGDIRRVVFGRFSGDATVTVQRFKVLRSSTKKASSEPASAVEAVSSAPPRSLGVGRLPIRYEPSTPAEFGDADEIRIDGAIKAPSNLTVVLRVDDEQSEGYATRFNTERSLPPGPFRWSIGLKGLKATDGRVLDHQKITRILLFIYGGSGVASVSRFEVARAQTLPADVTGYSLGGQDAPVPPGFERIAEGDSRLSGNRIEPVRRPAPDPLVANGLRGVKQLRLAAKPGRVRVTVWSEDPGEWEDLPHPMARRITINGTTALSLSTTMEDWIQSRYLRGISAEHGRADDAWTAYGRWRGDARTSEVEVGADGISIDLESADRDGLFLSAVLVEPAGSDAGLRQVNAWRAGWYREAFPVVPDKKPEEPAIPVRLAWHSDAEGTLEPVRATAAPDTGVRIRLNVQTDVDLSNPKIDVVLPELKGISLPTLIWAAERRLERRDTVLTLAENRLVSDLASRAIAQTDPRRYELWVSVPTSAEPGTYRGALRFADDRRTRSVPIEISVLAVKLPQVAKPAGFYLRSAPHLSYFPRLALESQRQSGCDLAFLKKFGLTGTAPPARAPSLRLFTGFVADMKQAQQEGVAPGWLVYNPAQTLFQGLGAQESAKMIAVAARSVETAGVPAPVWAIADEPSNPDQKENQLKDWVKEIRAEAPGIVLAGHFNSPADEQFVDLFDTLIINAGFGLQPETINRLASGGHAVWLYNTGGYERATAGLWLWRTAAQRYVQWHGRMPTADPFDPLDGREGDFQILFPSSQVCAPLPDVHADLLRMAEGVVDQRWLLWLEGRTDDAAKRLAADIRKRYAASWGRLTQLTPRDLDAMRNSITDLARSMN